MTDKTIATLHVQASDLKMLRESLCRAMTGLDHKECVYLQKLTDEIDVHRPLGSNGKHGNLHTPTCGCEDK